MDELPKLKLEKNQTIETIYLRDAENGIRIGVDLITETAKKGINGYESKDFVFTKEDEAFDFLRDVFRMKSSRK